MNTNDIILCGNGLELSQANKEFIEHKVDKLLRQDRHIIRVRVELELETQKVRGRVFVARGIVELNGPDLVASVKSKNAYAAIDAMVDKLVRKLRHRHRRRLFRRVHLSPIDLPVSLPKVPQMRVARDGKPGPRAA